MFWWCASSLVLPLSRTENRQQGRKEGRKKENEAQLGARASQDHSRTDPHREPPSPYHHPKNPNLTLIDAADPRKGAIVAALRARQNRTPGLWTVCRNLNDIRASVSRKPHFYFWGDAPGAACCEDLGLHSTPQRSLYAVERLLLCGWKIV
jgi:hypothetical protein